MRLRKVWSKFLGWVAPPILIVILVLLLVAVFGREISSETGLPFEYYIQEEF